MKEEIQHAAQWWTDQLRKSLVHRHNQSESDKFSPSSHRSAAQLENFRSSLIQLLEENYQAHWYPDEPLRGSAYRSISFDCKLDSRLMRAAVDASIDPSSVPLLFHHCRHSIMFCNPGQVKITNALTGELREYVYSNRNNRYGMNGGFSSPPLSSINGNHSNSVSPMPHSTHSPTPSTENTPIHAGAQPPNHDPSNWSPLSPSIKGASFDDQHTKVIE